VDGFKKRNLMRKHFILSQRLYGSGSTEDSERKNPNTILVCAPRESWHTVIFFAGGQES